MKKLFKNYAAQRKTRVKKVKVIRMDNRIFVTAKAQVFGERAKLVCNVDFHQLVGNNTINYIVTHDEKVYIVLLSSDEGSRVSNSGVFYLKDLYDYVNPTKIDMELPLYEVEDYTTIELTPGSFLSTNNNITKVYEYRN